MHDMKVLKNMPTDIGQWTEDGHRTRDIGNRLGVGKFCNVFVILERFSMVWHSFVWFGDLSSLVEVYMVL